MLRRPATTLTLSKEEVSDLISQLQEKALEERLKTRIPKQLPKATNEHTRFNVEKEENGSNIPVGLWKNNPLKPTFHSTGLLDQLNVESIENYLKLRNSTGNRISQEENPFYQSEHS